LYIRHLLQHLLHGSSARHAGTGLSLVSLADLAYVLADLDYVWQA